MFSRRAALSALLFTTPSVTAEEEKFVIKTDAKYDAKGNAEEAGKQFLIDAAKDPDVIKLESGLMYKVITKGSGKVHPLAHTPCDCHYAGKLVNGEQFDSSYDRGEPTGFAPNQVIKGWTEAMQLMVEGDKWEMYIPYDLAYGESGSPPKIPGKSTLVFTMEIVKVKGEGKSAVTCEPESLEDCSDQEKEYVGKMKKKSPADLKKEKERLTGMWDKNSKTKNLTRKQKTWLGERKNIVTKMTKDKEEL